MNIIEKLLNNKIVIHCNTEEKAENLLNYLDSIGFRWRGGNSLLANNYWLSYKENTCYYIYFDNKMVSFGSYNLYKNENYKIISYEEAMKEYIMERKETNFEHYRNEIKEIAKGEVNSNKACEKIIGEFKIEGGFATSFFEDIFAWGMDEYKEETEEMTMEQLNAKLRELGYNKKIKIVEK